MKKNKLIIAAGTGFLGNILIDHFKNEYKQIVILTRSNPKSQKNVRYVNWDAKTLTGWEKELENSDVVINLAGRSVDCRYTEKNKAEILNSRIESTKVLNEAVLQCKNPPKHWLNSSTSTIYIHSEDKKMTEENGDIGNDFSMTVAKKWEDEFFKTKTPNTKKTALRTSIVLGKNGGAFIPLKRLTQFGLGGKQGNGNQFISWIHELDFARAVDFIIQKELKGKINIVSPKPIKNNEFMRKLRRAIKIPFGIPTPRPILKLGAKLIGTESELVLKSRNVIPEILMQNGFQFEYPTIEKTLKHILK